MMNKIWRIVSTVALLCLVAGIACIGIGFFTGSSPVIIENHGSLTEYVHRLELNRDILQQEVSNISAFLGL